MEPYQFSYLWRRFSGVCRRCAEIVEQNVLVLENMSVWAMVEQMAHAVAGVQVSNHVEVPGGEDNIQTSGIVFGDGTLLVRSMDSKLQGHRLGHRLLVLGNIRDNTRKQRMAGRQAHSTPMILPR
jgi:hypothetical protein